MLTVDEATVAKLGEQFIDQDVPLAKRWRILFTLRNINGEKAIDAIAKGFSDPSALLKHEIAYVMGQMQNEHAVPILIRVLDDKDENPMVRHEAGEALGAIGSKAGIPALERHLNDPLPEIRETCEIALKRVQWAHADGNLDGTLPNPFNSVDPAPPNALKSVEECREILLDTSRPLFERYRAMFTLRNMNTDEAAKALVDGLHDPSALFKHEIAFVCGQMQNPTIVRELTKSLSDATENPMVRHEAAEALGAIASPECLEILERFKDDPERVVRESCIVALDMYAYENSGDFQYADGLQSC